MPVGTIVYSSPFVPPEWIAAHGLEPLRLVPDASTAAAGAGVCPFAHDFLHAVLSCGKATGVIFTTTCDQMRRIAEQAADALPTFLMHVPATWQTAGSIDLYIAELRRLSRFLVRLGGTEPTHEHLIESMLAYDAQRRPNAAQVANSTAIRIALVGGPLRRQDEWIARHITANGGTVVLDATETGTRSQPAPFAPPALHADPLKELARAYFLTIPDAFRRPDSMLHDYLRRELQSRRVQGVLLVRCVWCDQWHAQVARLKESLGVSVVEIDLGQDDHDLQRIQTRIDSLLDMVR